MVMEKTNRPVHEASLQTIFNNPLDWKFIYTYSGSITNNAYLLQTQFKITHNILPTNANLYKWKIIASPHCICGVVDSIIHYCIQCKMIQPFWIKFRIS